MRPGETSTEIDHQRVYDILGRFTLPVEVDRLETVFGPDASGDASVKLTFHVRAKAHIGAEELERLSKFLSEVTSALLQADIGGFPYTRLEGAA